MLSRQPALRYLLLACAVVLSLVGCTRTRDDSWARVRDSGVLRVGLDPTYPPFEVADPNGEWGFDVDLARALAADLGVEAHFTHFGYDGLYDALRTNQVDVLISALEVQPHLTRDFAFSAPYFNAGEFLLVPRTTDGIEEMSDLDKHTLAVELGSEGHFVANRWDRRLPNLHIQTYNSPDEALSAVAAGEADAALADAISARLYLAQHRSLKQAGPPVTVKPLAVVVRIEDEQLLRRLNASLEELQENGELAEIEARWLEQE